MSAMFLRQVEAVEFVRAILENPRRVLCERVLTRAMSFLVPDADYLARVESSPLDLLTFARALDAFLQNKALLLAAVNGEIESIDDIELFGNLPRRRES